MDTGQDHECARLVLAAAVTEFLRRRLLLRLGAIGAAVVLALAVVLRVL